MDISDSLTELELELFASLLVDGGRDGHYTKEFCDLNFCRNYLASVHKCSVVPNYSQSGLLLAFRAKGNPVCFSLICSPPLPKFRAEILLFSVIKSQRRKGYGKLAVKLIINEAIGQNIIARCMPKSTHMVQLLRNCGFVQVDLGKSRNVNMAYL